MATPTTYGSRDRNTFIIPSNYELNGISVPSNNGDTKYYLLVNSVTGEIAIKSPAVRTTETLAGISTLGIIGTTVPDAIGADRTVGIIPKDGVFKPELGSATTSEVQYFNSAVGQKAVKNQAVITAQKEGAQNAQQLIFPNSATPGAGTPATPGAGTPGTGTPGAGDNASTAPQNTIEDFNKEIGESADTRKSYRKDLSYPLNRSLKQDYIKFEMLKYEPRSLNAVNLSDISSGGGADQILAKEVLGNRNSTRNSIGTVTLPISSPISDTNTVNWSDDEASTPALQGQAVALSLIGGSKKTTQQQTSPPTQPESSSNQTGKLVGYALASAAVGGAGGNLLTRTTGAVVNPNLELLFRGPQLRTFSFTFPLSARGPKEAQVIKEIIRFFKQGMSVKRAQGALFLKSPHTFRIKYILADGKNKDHPWINMIKECALTNCSVNYTPAGNYATYGNGAGTDGNGAMTMYEITLNFSELEPVFDDDYAKIDGNADTMVGY